MTDAQTKKSEGLSLLEILLALSLLVTGLLAVLGLLPLAVKQGTSGDEQTVALFAAQQTLDQLLAAGQFLSGPPQTQTIPGDPELTVAYWGENEPGASPNPDLQLLQVEVRWLDRERVRSVKLKCLMAR